MLASKRRAVMLSREGDRFSRVMRVVTPQSENSQSSASRGRHSAPILLPSPKREGTDVATRVPQRPVSPSARLRRLDAAAARELATLRAKRAARISSAAAAGRRRFVTFCFSVGLVVLFTILGALSVLSWWFLLLPGVLLAGNVVASRMAAISNEKADFNERQRLEALTRRVSGNVEIPSKQPRGEEIKTRCDEVEKNVVDSTITLSEPIVEISSVEVDAEVSSERTDEELTQVKTATDQRTWEVQPLPQPIYLTKEKVQRRSVHIDTDLRGIPVAQAVPGRPVAASRLPQESEPAPATFTFDLNAVLESRRAQ